MHHPQGDNCTAMDLLHSWGVQLAIHLQTQYAQFEGLFSMVSDVADLHTTFFIIFPIWFHLRRDVGIKLIWVAVIGDWLNLVLKWVLCGERPYWWVQETRFYRPEANPVLQQFPLTCETGPGSPSGHAMGAAGVWCVMITALLSLAKENKCSPLLYRFLQIVLWMVLGLVLQLVCMSRVYLAAHFPHQVIVGAITGLIVAEVFSRVQWIYSASMKKYFCTTTFLTLFAVGFYLLLKAVGVDLLWTLEKAQKWCVKAEWVHLDSTPFAGLMRNMGTLFGLGLGLHSPLYTGKLKKTSGFFKTGCIVVSLLLLRFLNEWCFSPENHGIFYLLSFVKSAAALFFSTALVPVALSWIAFGKDSEKKL